MPVYLLGAGPGDPGLITVKGAEIMKQADVVVYDRLANFSGNILDSLPDTVEKINVGKSPDGPRVSQKDINSLLVELAKKYDVVVRLKGGDPFVFARGGEEAEALTKAGVSFEIIPGISSPIAVPAYAGIPVTLRHSSTSFTVITGHEDPDFNYEIDWKAAAKLGGTLVILMGVARWEEIAKELLDAGMDPSTPVAAIRWGTRPNQKTIRGKLSTLKPEKLEPPMTIVVGKVAKTNLSWFESLPLFGKKILVTRDMSQADVMAQAIFRAGGEPVVVPLIEIVGASDKGKSLLKALDKLKVGDWLVCTSVNGVKHLFSLIKDARALGGLQIAAIGSATANEFINHNIQPDLVPDEFVGEALLEAFPNPTRQGQKVLIARAAKAREVIPEGLSEKGYEVLVKEAYRTNQLTPTPAQIESINKCDVVTFASPSAIESFMALNLEPPKITACIGPITSKAALKADIKPQISGDEHTGEYSIQNLVDGIIKYLS